MFSIPFLWYFAILLAIVIPIVVFTMLYKAFRRLLNTVGECGHQFSQVFEENTTRNKTLKLGSALIDDQAYSMSREIKARHRRIRAENKNYRLTKARKRWTDLGLL